MISIDTNGSNSSQQSFHFYNGNESIRICLNMTDKNEVKEFLRFLKILKVPGKVREVISKEIFDENKKED